MQLIKGATQSPALMMASGAGDADRPHLKMCKISARDVRGRHGVAAASLQELHRKGKVG